MVNELCLVDVQADKLRGEMMDLQHGLAFTRRCSIKSSTGKQTSARVSDEGVSSVMSAVKAYKS